MVQKVALLTAGGFAPCLSSAIGGFVATYNARTHQEIDASPRDAWVGDGWLPRMPDSLEQLDGLLLTVPKHRTVQRDGIHFQGQRYISPTLAPFVGHDVTIRYDPCVWSTLWRR